VTDVKWLALRGKSIMQLDLPEKCFQDLTERDHVKINAMLDHPFIKVCFLKQKINKQNALTVIYNRKTLNLKRNSN
jgi:hypothetical protein